MREGLKSWILWGTEAMIVSLNSGSDPGAGNGQEDQDTDMPMEPPVEVVKAGLDDELVDLRNCMEEQFENTLLAGDPKDSAITPHVESAIMMW